MDTLTTIATRQYLPAQVEREKLAVILQAACAAPVGHSNYKGLHLSVVQNAELLKELAAYSGQAMGNPKYNPFYNAPTLIIVAAQPPADGQPVYIADVGCVMQNMQLAATELGLGCVFLWAMLHRITPSPSFIKALALPEGFTPVAALALGYPAKPLPERALAAIPAGKIATNFIF